MKNMGLSDLIDKVKDTLVELASRDYCEPRRLF